MQGFVPLLWVNSITGQVSKDRLISMLYTMLSRLDVAPFLTRLRMNVTSPSVVSRKVHCQHLERHAEVYQISVAFPQSHLSDAATTISTAQSFALPCLFCLAG